MKQLDRIEKIYFQLRENELCYQDIAIFFKLVKVDISIRQIQRDIKNVRFLLKEDEKITSRRNSFKVIYFKIVKTRKLKIDESKNNLTFQKETNFFELIATKDIQNQLAIVNQAISDSKKIVINRLKNDVTGDNFNFEQKNIELLPLKTIKHRGSTYVGGYNEKQEKIQIFDITQIKNIIISDVYHDINTTNIENEFNKELEKRFGVTKNINGEIYSIIIEFTEITGNFIKQHFWHKSQRFIKKGNIVQMHMQCGINRELLGWLFYWMYNCRVVEPKILKDYYDTTVKEMVKLTNQNNPLVYKNLFIPIESKNKNY